VSQPNDKPGYAALRRFRHSAAGAEYFLTTNLSTHGSGLEAKALLSEIWSQWARLQDEELWLIRTAIVMPDHVHLLISLGPAAELAACMRLFKGRVTPALRGIGMKWQEGFYEHRLREAEDLLPVFLYIFLNPYRAGLIPTDRTWPGYYCAPEDWKWFGAMTANAVPQPEWLK
jgi:putative transposase